MMKQWDIYKKCKTVLFIAWAFAVVMILMREPLLKLAAILF